MPPGVWLGDKYRDSIQAWTPSFHPSNINLSFENPEDALVKIPKKVLVEGRKTTYFFKAFFPGAPRIAQTELETYKKIAEAELGLDVRISRLWGVV